MESFRNREVLVTGGTGLIGRQVVALLCEVEANVRIVSLDTMRVHAQAEHLHGDLTDFALCRTLTREAEFVVHLAGVTASVESTIRKPASHFVATLMMNTNVLEACRLNGVRKALYTSSIGAYQPGEVLLEPEEFTGVFDGPPMDLAGWAKRMGELQVYAYRVQYGMENIAVVRPANVYGPGDKFDPRTGMVIPALLARIHSGERPVEVWGDGTAVRDFVFARDVAEGIILALHHGTGRSFLNLGSGHGCSIRALLETLKSIIPFEYRFDAQKPAGYPRRVMDISRARRAIGYLPDTPLAEGLRKTWEWFLAHEKEHGEKQDYFQE
jgi:GDP-L-fucose synthase